MNVYLDKALTKQLPGDLITYWALRTDLAPVPRTLEMVVRVVDGIETDLAVGQVVYTGRETYGYEIIWSRRDPPTGQIQGSNQIQTYRVIAALSTCVGVAKPRKAAIVETHQTIGSLYRASGSTVAIDNDFTVERFSCLLGEAPSRYIAQALQEESAALVLKAGRLSITRLTDFFKQTPIDSIGQVDTTGLVQSSFLEEHQIPSFYSTAADGSTVRGNTDVTRRSIYVPRKSERVLRNMSRVLVRRHVIDSQMAQEINAGDLLTIAGSNFVVMTGAHVMTHTLEGAITSNSRFWCGALSV